MGFNLLIFPDDGLGQTSVHRVHEWSNRLDELIPGMTVNEPKSFGEAIEVIDEADAAYGNVSPGLFDRANNLKWIACPQAGPPAGYYHKALVDSDVVVTNVRGIYNDYISAHIMSLLLAFANSLPTYFKAQQRAEWIASQNHIYLPDSTVIIVGVGGIGSETGRICAELGMNVIGIDPRIEELPVGVSKIYKPEELQTVLPFGDFIVVTVPETPKTQGMFGSAEFEVMKSTAFFINIGRGATTRLNDLHDALIGSRIAGAALDVFEKEPLPSHHPLWKLPNILITPHVAGSSGRNLDERRTELFLDNCVRFNEGRPLRNVVDKSSWF